MVSYFVEFYAEKKARCIFVEYSSDTSDDSCRENIRTNVMKAYPEATIRSISRQKEGDRNPALDPITIKVGKQLKLDEVVD
jgi:hypothetical protein